MSRVAGADEAYMLAEQYFGLSAPIQYLWIYPKDPGADVVLQLRDQLAAGSLNRRVHTVRMPLARHRWVRAERTPDLYIEPSPIPDGKISTWADMRLRESNLEPLTGHGWRLECGYTESGRFVLSLLVSHMITDGQGLYNALAAARQGTSSSAVPCAAEVAGLRGILGDLQDAGSQIVEAARAGRVIVSELWRQSRATTGKRAPRKRPKSTLPRSGDNETTLAIVDVDKHEWSATAKRYGGTSNGLLLAVIGGIVQRAGCPLNGEAMRICIAVNKRKEGEESANASGGVWIRLGGPIEPEQGLGEIRRLSKQALIEYAASGSDKVADNLQAIVRLLPKRLAGQMMRSVVGPDATVSNLGIAPTESIELGENTAESFAIRAIMQGHTAEDRRRQGPAIAAWAVEYADKVTLTVFGIDPDYFGDEVRLRDQLTAELTSWGQSPTFW